MSNPEFKQHSELSDREPRSVDLLRTSRRSSRTIYFCIMVLRFHIILVALGTTASDGESGNELHLARTNTYYSAQHVTPEGNTWDNSLPRSYMAILIFSYCG